MIITRTPFRISFFGGGTDYPIWYKKNGGAVLSTSIDKYCYINCRNYPPFFDNKHRIVWSKIELVNTADEVQHPIVREVFKHFDVKDGIEIHHNGDLPARSGLGTSSSFTVGLLHAMHALKHDSVTKQQLAKEAIYIEYERAKQNVGAQDQVAAAFGGLNKITFGGINGFSVEKVKIPERMKSALQNNLMLFFTGLSREAHEIAGEQIKNTSRKEAQLREMQQMVDRAGEIVSGREEYLDDFGRLLNESWKLKRGLSNLITNSKIDELYDAGIAAGALGGKLLGAGGGGFILFYARPEVQAKIREDLKDLLHVPFSFEDTGSQIIHNDPDDVGVHDIMKIYA